MCGEGSFRDWVGESHGGRSDSQPRGLKKELQPALSFWENVDLGGAFIDTC